MKSRNLKLYASLALLVMATSCASVPLDPKRWIDTSSKGACLTAQMMAQRCAVGIETNVDRCATAAVLAAVCGKANSALEAEEGLLAVTPQAFPGAGYTPRTLQTFWRDIPGGPERFGVGDPNADPWAIACATKTGGELAACLRSRYLVESPEVCAAYRKAFGVTTCGAPAGGWTRGPSNERWGSARQALNYFCENDPAVIGSTGRAGGWDCDSTAVEWARLGAFGGEWIVAEWQRRTAPPIPPAPRCGDRHPDPGETCENCPADLGPCPPKPPADPRLDCSSLAIPAPEAPRFVGVSIGTASTGLSGYRLVECRGGSLPVSPAPRPKLSADTRATLAKLCGWFRNAPRRAACASAVSEVLGIDAIEATVWLEEEP